MEIDSFITVLKKHGSDFHNPIALVNVTIDDHPLIYVNDKFEQLTGYNFEEIKGKNCRFLQNGKADPKATSAIRKAISNGKPICQDLLNFKKNGTPFYNRLLLLPLKEAELFYIGLQIEIPKEKCQKFKNSDELYLLDQGLNALSIFYLSILALDDESGIHSLDSTFERIRDLILNL